MRLWAFLILWCFFAPPCYSFLGGTHEDATGIALKKVVVDYFNANPLPCSDSVTYQMSMTEIFAKQYCQSVSTSNYMKAVKAITVSNVKTDSGDIGNTAEYHFDGERIIQGNQRLMQAMGSLRNYTTKQDFDNARTILGQILHSIQDFYSHTNWVEMGNDGPNYALGVSNDFGQVAPPEMQTCNNCTKTACANNILSSLNGDRFLTSGYFRLKTQDPEVDMQGNPVNKPENVGKCSHGGPFDGTAGTFATGGINKDSSYSTIAPHANLYPSARNFATDASYYYLTNFWHSLDDQTNFARLLNLQLVAALSLVIDTTGSMQPYIEGVKERCIEIVTTANNSIFQPSEYILVPFNDPSYGPVYTTTDPKQMIAWVNALTADGGGDIPEMSLSGLQLAEQASPVGTPIFLFTDAPPKDGYLFFDDMYLAQSKDLILNFCGANLGSVSAKTTKLMSNDKVLVDVIQFDVGTFEMYNQLAEATGGYVLTTTSDAGNIFDSTAFIDSLLSSSTVKILTVQDQNGPVVVRIPIDSTVDSFTVMLSSSYALNANYIIRGPDGNLYNFTTLTDTSTTKYLQINSSSPGTWLLNVTTSNNNYDVTIQGSSTWTVLTGLVKWDDQSGHPAFQPIDGNPIAGENVTLTLDPLSNEVRITSVKVTEATTLATLLTLTPKITENNYTYVTSFNTPDVGFSFTVIGEDQNGNPAQRLMMQTITSTTIELVGEWAGNSSSNVKPGDYTTLTFNVTNGGSPNTFLFTVTDSLKMMVNYTPSSIVLDKGQSALGTITLYANPSVPVGSASIVQLIAKTNDNSINNFLQMTVYVIPLEYDTTPPKCIIVNSTMNDSCESVSKDDCATKQWSAATVFSDHGSGLDHVKTRSVGANTTWDIGSFTIGLQDTNVSAYAYGDCCVKNTSLLVVDGAGLQGACILRNGLFFNACSLLDCPSKPDGDYADPTNSCATHFYSCSNGNCLYMPCPDNLIFYQPYENCLYPSQVPGCGGGVSNTKESKVVKKR